MFLFGRKKASGKHAKQQGGDVVRDAAVQQSAPALQGPLAQQGESQTSGEIVDVHPGSSEDVLFSEVNDVYSSVVSLVLEGLEQVGLAGDVDAVYVYGYIGDDRPVFSAFCLTDDACKDLPNLLGEDLFGQVFGLALDDLANLQGIFRRHGQPMPVDVRGRYDARGGGFNAAFSYDAFDRGERDAGVFDRFYGWMDDVAAGSDDLAR